MKKNKPSFGIDERNKSNLKTICSILYGVNIYGIIGLILFRQFVLHQDPQEFEDLNMLMSINVLVAIVAVLYWGGISFQAFKLSRVIAIYFILLVAGIAFISFKYGLGDVGLIWHKSIIVACVLAIMMVIWSTAALLGKRREDRALPPE